MRTIGTTETGHLIEVTKREFEVIQKLVMLANGWSVTSDYPKTFSSDMGETFELIRQWMILNQQVSRLQDVIDTLKKGLLPEK